MLADPNQAVKPRGLIVLQVNSGKISSAPLSEYAGRTLETLTKQESACTYPRLLFACNPEIRKNKNPRHQRGADTEPNIEHHISRENPTLPIPREAENVLP